MNKKRPIRVTFRLSELENDQLHNQIAKSGLTYQNYISQAVLHGSVKSTKEIKELMIEIKRLEVELNRQGNNLNQMARILNSRGYIDYNQELPKTLSSLRTTNEKVSETWQLLKQYLQKLQ